MNNYQRIKTMTLDEMAEWLEKYVSCDFCDAKLNKRTTWCEDFCENREQHIKQWLESEG